MHEKWNAPPQAQANLLELLRALKAQGLTIFFSSHHLTEIEKICDSVAILHRGTLRAHGPLDQLLGDGGRRTLRVRPLDESKLSGPEWRSHGDGSASRSVDQAEAPALLAHLQSEGAELLELRGERQSLEALFHRLTPEREELAS